MYLFDQKLVMYLEDHKEVDGWTGEIRSKTVEDLRRKGEVQQKCQSDIPHFACFVEPMFYQKDDSWVGLAFSHSVN